MRKNGRNLALCPSQILKSFACGAERGSREIEELLSRQKLERDCSIAWYRDINVMIFNPIF